MGGLKKTQPFVDILLSVYKPGPKLERTIHSVIAQDYEDFSLTVIDDSGSPGLVHQRISKLLNSDSRIRLVVNQENIGLTLSLVNAVSMTDCQYIARIDDGDIWRADKLSTQMRRFNSDPELIVVGSNVRYIDEKENDLGRSLFKSDHSEILSQIKKRRNIFAHSSIIFKAGINYRREFYYSQDLDLYLRASQFGKLHCEAECLTTVEINRSGITFGNKPVQRKFINAAFDLYEGKKSLDDVRKIKIRMKSYKSRVWAVAKYFYLRYVFSRLKSGMSIPAFLWLFLTVILYPPLLVDYVRKIS